MIPVLAYYSIKWWGGGGDLRTVDKNWKRLRQSEMEGVKDDICLWKRWPDKKKLSGAHQQKERGTAGLMPNHNPFERVKE